MPQPQDNARFVFLIILILWLNAGNDNGAGLLSAPSLIMARLQRQRAAYKTMVSSHWGDFAPLRQPESDPSSSPSSPPPSSGGRYLNLTGFREEDGLAWDDLDTFRERCLEWSRSAYPSVEDQSLWDSGQTMLTWQNATGSVHGPWIRQPASVHRDATSYNLSGLAALGWHGLGSGSGDGQQSVNFLAGYGSRFSGGSMNNQSSVTTDEDIRSSGQVERRKEDDGDSGRRHTVNNKHVVDWGRNITGPSGKILVRVVDQDDEESYEELGSLGEPRTGGLVRAATATVTIEDIEGTGSSYDMRLHGVHWPRQGVLMLTTTSEKFSGIFGLPHLTPSVDYFLSSQRLLNRTLDAALRKREAARIFGPPDPALSSPLWTSNVDGTPEGFNPAPRCEYIMYVQIHPLDASQFLPRSKANNGADRNAEDIRKQKRDATEVVESSTLEYRSLPQQFDYDQEQMTQIMLGIEKELRFPTGAPIFGRKGVPELKMSAVLYSPDCAYFIETKGPPRFAPIDGQHLHGMKSEVFVYEARLWMLAFAVVLGAQVRLLLGQVRETYTPSTLGRISFYTMSLMLLADGLVFAAASAWTLTASASFLPSLVVTFAAFISMTIGGSYLSEIYSAQEPERRRRERQQQQLQQQAAAPRTETPPIIIPSDQDIDAEIAENARAAATPLLPLPVTAVPAVPAATTVANASTANGTRPTVPFSSIAGRMVMLGVVLLFISLAASTWWAAVRSIYANSLALVYLSMWIPQIIRNIERNSRRALSWRFTIGQSVLRLLPIAYFYLRADNVLFAQPDRTSFVWLTGWMWVQLWVLAFQDVLGPRFGIPSSWVPEAWEYHPVLREDNVEAGGLPIGLVSTVVPTSAVNEPGLSSGNSAATTQSTQTPKRRFSGDRGDVDHGSGNGANTAGMVANTNIWTMDCAICCETLDVPVVRAGVDDPTSGGVAGVLARRQYMVTPCRHIFHTACLEGWLRFRLQCPICREELPPL